MGELYKTEHEKGGIESLRQLAKCNGIDRILNAINEFSKGSITLELYWLARAGFQEVESLLLEALKSYDEDEVTESAVALAYLGKDIGFDVIDSMCKGSYRVKLTNDPEWTFLAYLEEMDDDRAVTITNKIKSNEYTF